MGLNVGQVLFNFCQPKILTVLIDLVKILVWPIVQDLEKAKEIVHPHLMVCLLYVNEVAYSMLEEISQFRLEVCEELKFSVAID